jgi:hypothetical protein
MKLSDVTFFADPSPAPGQTPQPGSDKSGRTWGVANITGIFKLIGGTIESPIPAAIPYWSPTATDLLQVRFGGAIADKNCNGGGCVAPTTFLGFPYSTYFVADAAPYSKGGNAYLEIYKETSDQFAADFTAGPGTGIYGSFGTNIATNGSLWLDLAEQAGILCRLDPNADCTDVESTLVNGLTTGASTIYSSIVGGSCATCFAQDLFPLSDALSPRADLKMRTNLTALYDSGTNTWTDPNGWTAVSEDPVTGSAVPEPGTLALLGATLVGIAGMSRRRKN